MHQQKHFAIQLQPTLHMGLGDTRLLRVIADTSSSDAAH
jgi:hypothetical protein